MRASRLLISGAALAVLSGVIVVALLWWGYQHRSLLSAGEPLRAHLVARPSGGAALSMIELDVELEGSPPGEVTLHVGPFSAGRTSHAYTWDWKGATADNFSFIDFTRRMRADAAVHGWNVNVSEPSKLRLKIWRDWGRALHAACAATGATWRVGFGDCDVM